MELGWADIATGEIGWITLSFLFGFLASRTGLPPLVGYLVAGFALNLMGFSGSEALEKLSDVGITLLLFTIGLKLNPRVLANAPVVAITLLHTTGVTLALGAFVLLLGAVFTTVSYLQGSGLSTVLVIGFALSFSSTVFVVKTLQENEEINASHGQLAMTILIIQDILAVIFLAASTGKLPTVWAVFLVLLIPLRRLFAFVLQRVGHSELLILYGLFLALGGAELFELVGIKGDLGALVIGMLLSPFPKAGEMAKSMYSLKDLFLVGFFLGIGMSGYLSTDTAMVALALVPMVFLKSALFFLLMVRFGKRARTSLFASIYMTNFSEFGLIVAAISAKNGWIGEQWLVVLAIALSLSFAIAAVINRYDDPLYRRFKTFWMRFQKSDGPPPVPVEELCAARIAVFGLGRIGASTYERVHQRYGGQVIGFDFDRETVEKLRSEGHRVFAGDPSDPDFWDSIGDNIRHLDVILLAVPNLKASLDALKELENIGFAGKTIAIARYPEENAKLLAAGAQEVYCIYQEAGIGFADSVAEVLERKESPEPAAPVHTRD